MKILILNGSPKKEESDTMHITRAFLEGMREAAPQEITTIHVIDRHIEYCSGCFACMRNGGSCVHAGSADIAGRGRVPDILLFVLCEDVPERSGRPVL